MSENWLLNEDKRSEFETSGSKVTFKYQPNNSNYYNAMYLGLVANEKNKRYYWEFDVSAGRCSVGLAQKKAFADGFKLSGNLSLILIKFNLISKINFYYKDAFSMAICPMEAAC